MVVVIVDVVVRMVVIIDAFRASIAESPTGYVLSRVYSHARQNGVVVVVVVRVVTVAVVPLVVEKEVKAVAEAV